MRHRTGLAAGVLGLLFVVGLAHGAAAAGEERGDMLGSVTAPDFPKGLDWLNTDRPLSLAQLRGKVVLLDFWTYCCINCMHIIPDLKRLEGKYPNELVVIGVHSAKFTAEGLTSNIRDAVLRYGLVHPVVNDREMKVWNAYGVNSWPTVVLIDPAGKMIGAISGEGIYGPMDERIARVIKEFDADGRLNRKPLALRLERERMEETVLAFPGKVIADPAAKRLFIADSNHNRIVVVSLENATAMQVIGGGEEGMRDGAFAEASFNHPQGMAIDGDTLYVADTGNHAIRAADLVAGKVTTIAGTGRQARGFGAGGKALQTDLNSPWDIVLHDGALYVAMAGAHQLWRMDLRTGIILPHAGSGAEARVDGPLRRAALAQPSGIAADNEKLYFADSECSSVRSADIDPTGSVRTIVGGDLFDFGDRDGKGLDVRLQHPLGVAYHDGALYVADTYNNKIKRITLRDGRCETFLGADAQLNEPGGLTVAGDLLYIADTDNHAIRVADLKTKLVSTLQIKGLTAPQPAAAPFSGETVTLAEQSIEPGDAALDVAVQLPSEHHYTPGAPASVKVTSSDDKILAVVGGGNTLPLHLQARAQEGKTTVRADLTVYYCGEGGVSLCYFKSVRLILPVKVVKGAGGRKLTLAFTVAPPPR